MYKYRQRQKQIARQEQFVIESMKEVRKKHSRMGSRTAYDMLKKKNDFDFGRDKFEQLAFANGYRLKRKRQVNKTTWSQTVEVYPDLVSGLVLNNINQVYQSDIFYLEVDGANFYCVTIIDVYSRRVLCLHLSRSLRAAENINAFKQILEVRQKIDLKGCIFHSDRGSQYISDAHKKMLHDLDMKISMCKLPQQNAYVERVQGTLKNDYLLERQLTRSNVTRVARAIKRIYNEERSHKSLNGKTPLEFEKMIANMTEDQRPKMTIFKWQERKWVL